MPHGESFQYDDRASSRVTSIGFTPMKGMPFHFLTQSIYIYICMFDAFFLWFLRFLFCYLDC